MNTITIEKLETLKAKYSEYVRNNFNEYVKGVVNTLNKKSSTQTELYLQTSYIRWFS